MHMVMFVFSSNDGCNRVAFRCNSLGASVTELLTLLFKSSLDGTSIAMTVFAGLNSGHAMLVLLWQNLAVLYWLNRGMVMVLVDLTINGGLSLLMTLLDNVLLNNGRSNLLVDCGVMMTSLVPTH
jgi:hypothetical protein